jgi:hypothetical protein
MRIWIVFVLAAASFLACGSACIAQGNQTVEIEKPFESRTLGGVIRVHRNGGPVSDVAVADCSPDWKSVLSSTVSDANGQFLLRDEKPGLHYLRLTAPGFNLTLLRVRVKRSSRQGQLNLEMTVGT